MSRHGAYLIARSGVTQFHKVRFGSLAGQYQTFAQGRITHCFWAQENPDHPFIRSWSWQFFPHLTTTSPGTRES